MNDVDQPQWAAQDPTEPFEPTEGHPGGSPPLPIVNADGVDPVDLEQVWGAALGDFSGAAARDPYQSWGDPAGQIRTTFGEILDTTGLETTDPDLDAQENQERPDTAGQIGNEFGVGRADFETALDGTVPPFDRSPTLLEYPLGIAPTTAGGTEPGIAPPQVHAFDGDTATSNELGGLVEGTTALGTSSTVGAEGLVGTGEDYHLGVSDETEEYKINLPKRSVGRRTAAVARKKDKRTKKKKRSSIDPVRRKQIVGAILGVLLISGLGYAAANFLPDTTNNGEEETAETERVIVDQDVVLLIRTAEEGEPAVGLTLLTNGPDGTAFITFIPATTLMEIPGVGLERLGQAAQYGGPGLAAATISNAIGIDIAATISVDEQGLASLIQRVGGADIDVPSRLVRRDADGSGEVVFEAGEQFMNGRRLAEFWGFQSRGDSELDTFPRQQIAVEAFLQKLAEENEDGTMQLESVFEEVPVEVSSDVEAERLREILAPIVDAAENDSIVVGLLPVDPIGSGATGSYVLNDDAVVQLINDVYPGAIPEYGDGSLVATQVLNGVGTPGIGAVVEERLRGQGIRIVRTENARNFDFIETQIVIYEETPEMLAAAERVRESLGVGTILISRQPQSVLDLTLVIGSDFDAS